MQMSVLWLCLRLCQPKISGDTLAFRRLLSLLNKPFAIIGLKANVSQKILNWHSLRHSHSAEICIHFYCLSWLRQASDVRPVLIIFKSARGNRLARDDSLWSIVHVYLTLIIRTMYIWRALVGNWTRGYQVPDFIIVLPRLCKSGTGGYVLFTFSKPRVTHAHVVSIFKVLKIQKWIVSKETICGNTVIG